MYIYKLINFISPKNSGERIKVFDSNSHWSSLPRITSSNYPAKFQVADSCSQLGAIEVSVSEQPCSGCVHYTVCL